jgi:hypothetical protein
MGGAWQKGWNGNVPEDQEDFGFYHGIFGTGIFVPGFCDSDHSD